MGTVSTGETETIYLGAFQSLSLNNSGTGTVTFTSSAEKLFSGFTANINSGSYGPFGFPVTATIRMNSGSVEHQIVTSDTTKGGHAAEHAAMGGASTVLLTSGTSSATANTDILQTALTAGGLVSVGGVGTFYINGTLLIPDQTTLYVSPGTTLKLADSSNCSMVRNSQYSASTATVTATSSGKTITVSWTAHGKAVGDWIAIQGATQGAYNGVFQVATAPTSDSLTVTADYTPSATTATGTLLARAANVGCGVIIDGTLDANQANQVGIADDNTRHAVIMYNVARPVFAGRNLLNAKKYMWLGANVREVTIGDCNFNTASDGIHFQGVIGATIGHLSGYCGDDMLAFTCGDYTQYELFRGFVDGVVCQRLHGLNSAINAIKVSGGAHRTKSIVVHSVSGHFQGSIAGIIEDTNLTATYLETLKIGSVTATWGGTNAVQVTKTTTSCTVDQVVIDSLNVTPPTGTVGVFNASGSGATIKKASIRDLTFDATNITGASSIFSQTSSGAVDECEMERFRIVGTSNMYGVLQDFAVSRMYLGKGSWSGGGFLVRVNSGATTTPDVYLSDCTTGNTNNPIDFRKSANFFAHGWKHAGSSAININGAGTVNLYGDMVSTNTHVAGIAGGMTVNNTIESSSQSPTFAASYTPDLGLGCNVTVGTLTAGITINNPSNVPAKGTRVKFFLLEDGTGGWNVSWGTSYVFPTAWSNTGNTAGKKSSVEFVSDGTVLIARGANSWY